MTSDQNTTTTKWKLVRVDDENPDLLYQPANAWFTGAPINQHGPSNHGTVKSGARARFSFKGVFVAVYGSIPGSDTSVKPPVSSYTLDDHPEVLFAPPLPDTLLENHQFFRADNLKDGVHTLTITSKVDNTYFWLDYLEFVEAISDPEPTLSFGPAEFLPSSGTSSASSTSSSRASSTSSTSTSSVSLFPSETVQVESILKQNPAVMAGAVVGVAFAIAAILGVLVFFFIRHRRKQLPPSAMWKDILIGRSKLKPDHITPFDGAPRDPRQLPRLAIPGMSGHTAFAPPAQPSRSRPKGRDSSKAQKTRGPRYQRLDAVDEDDSIPMKRIDTKNEKEDMYGYGVGAGTSKEWTQ